MVGTKKFRASLNRHQTRCKAPSDDWPRCYKSRFQGVDQFLRFRRTKLSSFSQKTSSSLLRVFQTELSMANLEVRHRHLAISRMIRHQQDHSIHPVWLVPCHLENLSEIPARNRTGHFDTVEESMAMSGNQYCFVFAHA